MKKVMDLTVKMAEKVAGGASCSCSCSCTKDDQNAAAKGAEKATQYLKN